MIYEAPWCSRFYSNGRQMDVLAALNQNSHHRGFIDVQQSNATAI
jgi:hypothetical protein